MHNERTNLFSYFDIGRLRADPCRVHDGSHVDARTPVEESPEETWQVRDQRLKQEDQRHPLIVIDVRPDVLFGQPLSRYCRFHRQIVRVTDPADGVGVVAMALGELSRAPAGDRLTHELLRGHKCAEADQDDDGVLSI